MKKNKKGFTIVELVIVIAVIAILAAVLIPTFAGLIEKANLSNDRQMVTMMNKNLAVETATKKPETAGEALNALYGAGYNEGKFSTYSNGFHYAYHLENNRFYLLNASNQVVFPEKENVSASDMWGLYRDNGNYDKIGSQKYVALSSPANQAKFEELFGNGTYTIDLNDSYLALESDNAANITIVNGSVKPESGFTVGEGAITLKEYNKDNVGVTVANDTATFADTAVIGDGTNDLKLSEIGAALKGYKKVVISNCAFGDYETIKGLIPYDAEEVVIEGCTFVNTGHWALQVMGKYKLTVRNNTFTNCDRGINVGPAKEGSVIENNTFNLSTSGKGILMQFAYIRQDNVGDAGVVFKNNTVNSAKTLVRLHEHLFHNLGTGDKPLTGEPYTAPTNDDEIITAEQFTDYITFEGNTYPENVTKVIVDDVDAVKNNETRLSRANEIKAALEKIIK